MKLSDIIIKVLELPHNKIEVENNQFWFESFEYLGEYNKGYVINTDSWIHPEEEYWQISYSFNGDIFELEEEDKTRVEEWILTQIQ